MTSDVHDVAGESIIQKCKIRNIVPRLDIYGRSQARAFDIQTRDNIRRYQFDNHILHEKCIFYKKSKTDIMMKNNLCITTLLLCLHFNFPRFSFLYTIPLLLRFKIFDFLITPFYSTFMMSIFHLIRTFRAKNIVVFRMFVALYTIFLRSQEFGCYISAVKFHRILVMSVSESVQ